jgi:hypothetical protein
MGYEDRYKGVKNEDPEPFIIRIMHQAEVFYAVDY